MLHREITVFRDNTLKDERVEPSQWKAKKPVHDEDILCGAIMNVMPMFLATGGFDGLIVIWNSVSESPSKFLTARRKPVTMQKSGSRRMSRHQQMEAATAAKLSASKLASASTTAAKTDIGVDTASDPDNDFSCAITCLRFLNTRTYGKDCNLISCGGDGWVRFWDVASTNVCGEFIAHAHGKDFILLYYRYRIYSILVFSSTLF